MNEIWEKKNKQIVIICIFTVLFMINVQAAPLRNIPQNITQPDGITIECFASGDEFLNYLHDGQGNIIIQNTETGEYVYAIYKGDDLAPSSYKVGSEISKKEILQAGIVNQRNLKVNGTYTNQLIQHNNALVAQNAAPTTGIIDGVTMFVKFQGEGEFVEPDNQFASYFDNPTGNSLNNYFKEVSYNQLNARSYFYPSSESGTYSYMDAYPRNYYQPYSSANLIGYKDEENRYTREMALYSRALAEIESQVLSSLNIDRNNDGYVDSITMVVSGSATASINGGSSLLWPHALSSSQSFATFKGKGVNRVVFQLADVLLGKDTSTAGGVGVLAHEYFHLLGAPDLYHYSMDGRTAVGPWDLMEDTNSKAPQHMLAYMKYKYGKWIINIPRITQSGTYSLNSVLSTSGNAYTISSSIPNEYYVLEYRKKSGIYEEGLPAEGLLVYRIDTTVTTGNRNGPPDEVYVYRPYASENTSEINQAPLSIASGRTSMQPEEMFLQDGSIGNTKISNVREQDGKVYFDVQTSSCEAPKVSVPNGWDFYGQMFIQLTHPNVNAQIFYTLDNSEPTNLSTPCMNGQSIAINQTANLKTVAYVNGQKSLVVTRTYTKVDSIETSHPYNSGMDKKWVINIPDATDLQLTFDAQTNLEEDYDYLAIYDENDELIRGSAFTGSSLAGQTITVKGSKVVLRFTSDSSEEYWGFKINSIVPIGIKYKGFMDTPASGATLSDRVMVGGWYIYGQDIKKVEILVDGVVQGEATRQARAGFESIFPGYNVTNAGYEYNLDTTKLSNGTHTLTVKATGTDETTDLISVNVNVLNGSNLEPIIAEDNYSEKTIFEAVE